MLKLADALLVETDETILMKMKKDPKSRAFIALLDKEERRANLRDIDRNRGQVKAVLKEFDYVTSGYLNAAAILIWICIVVARCCPLKTLRPRMIKRLRERKRRQQRLRETYLCF